MAVTFTSWQALYTAMLNTMADFAAGGKFAVNSYTITTSGISRQLSYRSFEEFQKGLEYVKYMSDQESGTIVRRTYAKQGGGNRW